VLLTEYQAYLLEVVAPIYDITDDVREIFCCEPEGGGDHTCGVCLRKTGDRISNPGLADTLELLAREGDHFFYEGGLARSIVEMCIGGGGHITLDDLKGYRLEKRRPIERRYRDATIAINPPPSAGGILIAFALEVLGRLDMSALEPGSVEHARALIAAMNATNRVRAEVMDDSAPSMELLSEELVARYAAEVLPAPESHRGTTHVSVIDAEGNAASATVSNGEGCGHLVPGCGFMLNNMLGEEDLVGTTFGEWATNQRMSSMMAPTAIRWDDGRYAVLGSGGSNRIRTALLQVISFLVDHRFAPDAAIDAPRLHLEGDHLDFEAVLPTSTQESLAREYGDHTVWPDRNMFFGGVHAAFRAADGALLGAGDPRRAGVIVKV
jgi:gamma-glutamyltranspeptidase / glutathione hydrolase